MQPSSLTRATYDPWVFEYAAYEPSEEPLREALCTLGNGRFATRGSVPEASGHDEIHYAGTYAAGLYNRLTDLKAGREITNESLVNLPNWLFLTFRIDGGPWFGIDDVEVTSFRQALEIDRGMLVRQVGFTDEDGRETTLTQRRLVSMERHAVAALETSLRPDNWAGTVTFRSGIDGRVENRNVDRYKDLASRHLDVTETSGSDDFLILRARTSQSRVEVVTGARHRIFVDDDPVDTTRAMANQGDLITEDMSVEVSRGSEIRLEKVVALHTSRDTAISEPAESAGEELRLAPDFSRLEHEHVLAWRALWKRFRVDIEADPRVRLITNLHVFHLLQVASPHVFDLDAGIPARGLHGEAYRGHVFWDELFVFPVIYSRSPEVAKALLRYRHRRLPAARRLAAASGYRGAMFPWQSGSDGREETQEMHLNPRSGRWLPDLSHRQRHINIAVAYNCIQYQRFTGDIDFLSEWGGEMLVEIARFWANIAEYDRMTDRYDIVGVMGPDEFHDDDPNWDGDGLRNNAYTNVMVSWLLRCIPDMLRLLPGRQRAGIWERLQVGEDELELWDELSRKLKVPLHDDGIISQFEGYEALDELDWEAYRNRYENIERLDRILEAEGDTVNRYKASKQADVLMLFYLLSPEELTGVLDHLGVKLDEETYVRNIDYYLDRTSHGSTLSRLVHSWVLARSDRRRSMELFRQALESDVSDIQGGTTKEGIHLGAMAGTVDLLQRAYTGMETAADGVLHFDPNLPPEIGHLDFGVYFRGRWIDVSVSGARLTLHSEETARSPIDVGCRGETFPLGSGETRVFESPADPS